MNTEAPLNLQRTALRYLGRGLIQGIGFCIALALAYLVASHARYHPPEQPNSVEAPLGEESNTDPVVLSAVSEEKMGTATAILGVASNNGKAALHSVHIQANLFNHGKFVDQYFDVSHRFSQAGQVAIFQDFLRLQRRTARRTRQLQA